MADKPPGGRTKRELRLWLDAIKVPFFDFLSNSPDPSALHKVAENITSRAVEAGQYIFREGDEGTAFYCIYEGEVNITKSYQIEVPDQHKAKGGGAAPSAAKKVDDTAEIILKRLHRGDTFGETALNQDAGVRTASALVHHPSRILVVEKDVYRDVGKEHEAALVEERMLVMSKCAAFASWDARRLRAVCEQLVVRLYDAHSVIAQEGDAVRDLCVIKSGVVKVMKTVPEAELRGAPGADGGGAARRRPPPDDDGLAPARGALVRRRGGGGGAAAAGRSSSRTTSTSRSPRACGSCSATGRTRSTRWTRARRRAGASCSSACSARGRSSAR